MKFCFRWFGKEDPISLTYIRQIPIIEGIVSALYDVPVGEVWPKDKLTSLKGKIEEQELELTVIESIPVHEDIKLGRHSREKYINNYNQNIRNMGDLGIPILCYNIMAVFDWTRTDLEKKNPDGSVGTVIDKVRFTGNLAILVPPGQFSVFFTLPVFLLEFFFTLHKKTNRFTMRFSHFQVYHQLFTAIFIILNLLFHLSTSRGTDKYEEYRNK